MLVLELIMVLTGLVFILLGIADIFLTILHPDRDGPASIALNRVTWRLTIAIARRFPSASNEVTAAAGGVMIAGTILLWMMLQVVGFALAVWPVLGSGFVTSQPGPPTFFDALYWSGVTFTTLGYGDVLPTTPALKMVALTESVLGFALVGAAITFLLSVFQGIEHRDAMALRIYSETRRTWDGTLFVLRVLDEEGSDGLLRHVETWADEMRHLHERLYRFQPLAFYVRTRSEKHDPERMLEAVGEVALTTRILAHAPVLDTLRPAADEIDIAFTEFALSALRHHGSKESIRAMEVPRPTDADHATVADIRARIRDEMTLEDVIPGHADEDQDLLVLATRVRVFMEELDRLTQWRAIRGVA